MNLDAADAQAFIESLISCDPESQGIFELRKKVFSAVELALRLFVAHHEDPSFPEFLVHLDLVDKGSAQDTWQHACNKQFRIALEDVGPGNLGNPLWRTVGVHFVDPGIGRHSRIWIPPMVACPAPDPVVGGDDFAAPDGWWMTYPDLWFRAYKDLLHPSTSLINAFEASYSDDGALGVQPITNPRFLLDWVHGPLQIRWDNDNGEPENPAEHGSQDDDMFRKVSFRRYHALRSFVETSRQALAHYHDVLRRNSVGEYPVDVEEQIIKVRRELDARCVVTRLHDARMSLLQVVASKLEAQQDLLSVVIGLSGPEGGARRQLEELKVPLHLTQRDRVSEVIQVLQTVLFNSPVFCSPRGLIMDRWDFGAAKLYVIFGLANRVPDDSKYSRIRDVVRFLLSGAERVLRRAPTPPPYSYDTSPVALDVMKKLREISTTDEGFLRWLDFVHELSSEAIHEGRDLSFLVGIGSAHTPDVRCRLYEGAPEHLTRDDVPPDLIVHWVKSYFSVFARPDERILWFDRQGRFHGIYEKAPMDSRANWTAGWGNWGFFAQLKGRRRFDLLDVRNSPRLRVIGDEVVNLESPEDIRQRTEVAANMVFSNQLELGTFANQLVAHVIEEARRVGHGAGLVIVNDCSAATHESPWRFDLEKQIKPLAAGLKRFMKPILKFTQPPTGRDLVGLAMKILPLTELDGAVVLRFSEGILNAEPARHVFPLIIETDGAKPSVLDFFKLAEDGRKPQDPKKAWSSLESILSREDNSLEFEKLEDIKFLTACIQGLVKFSVTSQAGERARRAIQDLSFLNSAGTRHHSLWGITLTSKKRLFVATVSQDGKMSIMWDGRLVPSSGAKEE